MWKPQSQEQTFTCDLCGGVLPLEISSDKKCRCERCGKIHLLSDQAQDGKRAGPTPPVVSAQAHASASNIIFYCLACQSRLVARCSAVGQKTKCPTCGVGNTVPKWLKSPPPGDQSPAIPQGNLESTKVQERAGTTESEPPKSRSRESKRSRPSKRPELPAAPLLHGVALMLWSSPIPALWLAYSISLALVATLFTQAMGQASQGAYAILAILLLTVGCVLGTLWWMAVSALWCSILAESSEGHDRLYNPPPFLITECMKETATLGAALAISAIPGWVLGKWTDTPHLWLAIGMLTFFPILLLSALEAESSLDLFSARLWGSLVSRPGHWIFFYLETWILASLCVWPMVRWLQDPVTYYPIWAPWVMAGSLIYFRLLGRLGWWLAESLPLPADENEPD